jgi:tetratricopeptide (TPR) repeat protein
VTFELKPLSRGAIPAALEKAERYRLLNEPSQAESICLDVLAVEPQNQTALVTLLLALSDQFEARMAAYNEALELVPRLEGDYAKVYYEGILCERRGRAHHRQASAFSGATAYEWFVKAMTLYERAQTLRAEGDDESIMRWNTCARTLMRHAELAPLPDQGELPLE